MNARWRDEMKSENLISMSERSESVLKDVFKGESAYPTFSSELNLVLSGGLLPGKLYAIEGPPDGTKSAFAALLMDKLAAEHELPALFISSTLSARELYIRSISRLSRVHSGEIEGRSWLMQDWLAVHGRDAAARIKGRIKDADDAYRKFADKIFMVEVPVQGGMHISEVRTRLERVRQHFKDARGLPELPVAVLIIDTLRGLRYKQEAKGSGEPTREETILILKDLRELAHSSGCPILALVDGAAFGRLYMKLGMLPSSLGHELGFTAYHADTTILMETEDTLLSDAIQELYDRGQDRDAAKLEEARSRFPLSNPKIGPYFPTYARLLLSTRGTGAVRNIYFIYLKAVCDFLDLAFKREAKKVYE